MAVKKISSALISVYNKENLESLVKILQGFDVKIYSTGGTQKFIADLGVGVTSIEEVTGYPSIFGGRVKTLHPKIFGGILYRRDNDGDQNQQAEYEIPPVDMVIVDLYPFEETVKSGATEEEIVEKIDIGGISLIRAAAKNFRDVFTVSSRNQYQEAGKLISENNGSTSLEDRKKFAARAFGVSSHYDTAIFNHFDQEGTSFKISETCHLALRYGENPHQQGVFYGQFDELFTQLNGKQVSYNNLVDIDAATSLMAEFEEEKAFIIIKHTNACGAAVADNLFDAYKKALAGDPVSAFGGVLICNDSVDVKTSEIMNELFFDILIAPGYAIEALNILKSKKNRILLQQNSEIKSARVFRSLLNGVITQDHDHTTDRKEKFNVMTKSHPSDEELEALEFAAKIAKHTKSNTIVLAKDNQLLASGVGQTSRVDALKQAIAKATHFEFDLQGAVMASDAFFPFADCVQIANEAGITAVIQPGGSIRDQESIDYCDHNNMSMVFTGTRHFKH